jgi:site-specific DNA recombinase
MNLIPPPSTLPPGSTVWAYLRDSGGDNQDRSITRQLEVIQDYCARHRLELVHVYRDEAKSGTTTAGRDDFMRMIAQSDKHENNPDGLLLWSFSRFGRNLDDATYYKSRLRRNDIIIHSLTDQIPEGPYSRFVETLVDISNEERSRQTSIDARDGLRSMVMQGAVPGTPPLGFKRVPMATINPRTGEPRKNHRWEPDENITPRICRAFQMKASGSPISEIHRITRLYGSTNSYTTFFKNKIYIGILEFGDLVVENYCEPVIDMDTWNAVQKRVEEHAHKRFKDHHPKRVKSVYLFSGFIVCARCGTPMNGNTVSRDNIHGRDEAYRCSKSKRHAGCDAGRISRWRLEELVLSTLDEFILQPDNLAALQDIAIENQTHGETRRAERRQELHQERSGYSREVANLTHAIAAAGHSEALIKELKAKESQLAQVRKELDELEIPIEPVPRLSPEKIELASKRLRQKIHDAPLEEKRRHLREIIAEIRAERSGKNIFALITFYYPPPFDFAPMEMLPISHAPVGAPRYRQLFSYPAVAEIKTRSE